MSILLPTPLLGLRQGYYKRRYSLASERNEKASFLVSERATRTKTVVFTHSESEVTFFAAIDMKDGREPPLNNTNGSN